MLTVLLATRNRAPILADVLEAYCRLAPLTTDWKLVVVDNGSSDQTADVLAAFSARLPLLSVLEPRRGKNLALNTGLQFAEGDLIVFTDDDAFPQTEWLIQLRRAADSQSDYSVFGGVVVPRWETPAPDWIRWVMDSSNVACDDWELRAGPVYSITDPSLEEGPILPYFVFGPNMAIRSRILESGIRFDPSIGPRGSAYPMGGETRLLLQLNQQGHRAWHVRRAVVEHLIRDEQLKKAWVLERAVRYGRGQYRLFHMDELNTRKLWTGMPPKLFRRMVNAGVRLVKALISFRQESVFRALWGLNYFRGQLMEARTLARENRAQTGLT